MSSKPSLDASLLDAVDRVLNDDGQGAPAVEAVSASTAGLSLQEFREEYLEGDEKLIVTDLARKFGLNDNDPLWSMFAALQYHLRLYEQMPAKIKAVSEEGAHILASMLRDAEKLPIETRVLVAEVKTALDQAQVRLQKAAGDSIGRAVDKSIEKLDANRIVGEVSSKVSEKVGRDLAKTYGVRLGFTLVTAGALVCLALGTAFGWMIGRSGHDFAQQIASLATCQSATARDGSTVVRCAWRGNGAVIEFTPR